MLTQQSKTWQACPASHELEKACAILALGKAVPPHAIEQGDAAAAVNSFCLFTPEQARWLGTIYRRAGVRKRHMVVLDRSASPRLFYPPATDAVDRGATTAQRVRRYDLEARSLAHRAALQAVNGSGVSRGDITHLITISCTGFAAPGVDISLIRSLGLHPTVQRTHIGFMGCHGALNGLQVARALTRADPQARVLLCAVEVCSVHFQYAWNPDQVVASALFADGAAALLLGRPLTADAGDWQLTATGTFLIPSSEDAMTWRIGDHGFEMTLAVEVPELIRENLRSWLEKWLAEQGVGVADIASWAVHPGGPRVLDAVQHSLSLPANSLAASRDVLADHGNMSSPTVVFILDRLRSKQAPLPCVVLAFGPGLVVEAALFQ
jgi:alkylresorcinol/alkylpyrone synthase